MSDDEREIQTFEKNMPVWGAKYHMDMEAIRQLDVPVINIGPYGKDAHKKWERLEISYSMQWVPNLTVRVIRYLFNSVDAFYSCLIDENLCYRIKEQIPKRRVDMDTSWMEPALWLAFFNIIIIDLILSGDNAVVIGMAARKLPPAQRKKAIVFGAGIAVLLRSTLTVVAAYLLNIPLLMTVGGILLIGIAVKLLVEEDDGVDVHAGDTLKSAIKTIIIADVVMSLDNVLAVPALPTGMFFSY